MHKYNSFMDKRQLYLTISVTIVPCFSRRGSISGLFYCPLCLKGLFAQAYPAKHVRYNGSSNVEVLKSSQHRCR